MKFKHFLTEASNRKNAMYRMSETGYQIFLHLIKILYFDDPINTKHYIKEINGHFARILSVYNRLKTPLSKDTVKSVLMGYYKQLGSGVVLIPYDVRDIIANKLKRYHDLDTVRTEHQLEEDLNEVYDVIAKQIVSGQSFDLAEILKEYLIGNG